MPDAAARAGGLTISADDFPAIQIPAALAAWLEDGIVTAHIGFDAPFERRHLAQARNEGCALLSIRVAADEVLIGPRWVPGGPGGCAGCAEVRLRVAVDHPLRGRADVNAGARGGWPAVLAVLVDVGLDHLVDHPLDAGEMLTVGLSQTRRRRVMRSIDCPLCGPGDAVRETLSPPAAMVWQPRPSANAVPLRGASSAALGDDALRRLVDARVGPVLQVRRDDRAPFAMSSAFVPAARAPGHGRGTSFDQSRRVAILEAYERLGAVPDAGQILLDLAFDDVRGIAVDPASLGRYSRAQLDHPNAQVLEYHRDTPMDWVYGYRLDNGEARLIPADVAYYGYHYRRRRDERSRDRFFAESSSGCALGNSLEEAALHGLVELIERDSFLLAWCRRVPLPAISHRSVDDPTSRMLLESIETRGFDVHLLATTFDLGLPAIWALAVNRSGRAVPATFSAAGSSPVPADAVRAALWELAQLVARPVDWDVEAVGRLLDDPSLVDTIEDHVHLYAMPQRRDRMIEVLGGPVVTLTDAFPGWPLGLCQAAEGDVRGALGYLLDLCRRAGLHDALVVDQSTAEHVELGMRVARVVVPGMLPMCFGSPHQRLGALARREQALATVGRNGMSASGESDLLLDPHPFP